MITALEKNIKVRLQILKLHLVQKLSGHVIEPIGSTTIGLTQLSVRQLSSMTIERGDSPAS